MNKLVINHLEKLFVTSDAATIVEELEVVHPAARMITRAAQMQVQEVGDGSNFVVTIAGELLSQAEELLRIGVHPSEIVEGYKRAAEQAYTILEGLSCFTLENPRDKATLARALTPVLASKHRGYEDMLASLVADAVISVMPPATKKASVSVDNVRVAKLIGGSVSDSQIVRGVVVHRDSEGSVKHVTKAKIAVFGCGIEAAAPETRGTVVIKSADELKAYNKGEEKMMEDAIRAIADSGAKVVVAGGAISEIAMHFIEKVSGRAGERVNGGGDVGVRESPAPHPPLSPPRPLTPFPLPPPPPPPSFSCQYGMLAVKISSKFELRRLCKAVNATAQVRVGAPVPGELGYADDVSVQELSSRLVTVFRQDDEDSGIATIVLRGATMNLLDDMERAIDDATNVARVLCKDGRMVPGAGAAEMELASQLSKVAATTPGLEQYALAKFAEAMEVVARTLAENSGQNERDIITSLYTAHANGKASFGVDVDGTGTKDAAAAFILDSLAVKMSALRMAAETAITVLRVDTIIMSKQAGGPKPRQPGAPDDD
jgi:T-complex protein 1 subunit theta